MDFSFTKITSYNVKEQDLLSIQSQAFSHEPWNIWNEAGIRSLLMCDSVWGYHIPDIAFILLNTVLDVTDILTLCVAPGYWRKGIGKKLLQGSIQSLIFKPHEIFLEVDQSNDPAIALYEKMGFKIVGERINYYTTPNGPKDAWAMSLLLEEIDS